MMGLFKKNPLKPQSGESATRWVERCAAPDPFGRLARAASGQASDAQLRSQLYALGEENGPLLGSAIANLAQRDSKAADLAWSMAFGGRPPWRH